MAARSHQARCGPGMVVVVVVVVGAWYVVRGLSGLCGPQRGNMVSRCFKVGVYVVVGSVTCSVKEKRRGCMVVNVMLPAADRAIRGPSS